MVNNCPTQILISSGKDPMITSQSGGNRSLILVDFFLQSTKINRSTHNSVMLSHSHSPSMHPTSPLRKEKILEFRSPHGDS